MAEQQHEVSGGVRRFSLGTANEKQHMFYMSRTLYTAYGGARGGGKTHAVRIKAVGGAMRWEGIRILIVRRTYPELQQNHIEPLLRFVPDYVATYNSTHRTMTFANGSTIHFGHYSGGASEREYQGQEYDWIFMDEATQFTERDFRYLGGCLRGVSAAPKRFYITCNPGGVGHAWVKRLFIDRDYRDGENPEDYSFIFACVEDNHHLLKSSPSYVQMLDALPENVREAYRYGKWDALSGVYFSEFDVRRHVTSATRIPRSYTRFRAFDYGLDMLSCLWIAISPEGKCVVYRELRRPNLIVSEAASAILAATPPEETIAATFAPPDMWSRQKDTGTTMATLFARNGVPVVRASNARIEGHMQIKEMLRGDGIQPSLVIFDTCRGLLGDIAAIEADANRPGDCAREPHDVTHSIDALRYFCVSNAIESPTESDSAANHFEELAFAEVAHEALDASAFLRF